MQSTSIKGSRINKFSKEDSEYHKKIINAHYQKSEDLLKRASGQLNRSIMLFEDNAKQTFLRFCHHIEILQAPGNQLESVSSYASKAGEHVARIAAAIACYMGRNEIWDIDVADAIEIVRFFIFHRLMLKDEEAIPESHINASKIMTSLSSSSWKNEEYVSRTEISQYHLQLKYSTANKKDEIRKEAIEVLVDKKHLIPIEGPVVIRGKTRKENVYLINRKVRCDPGFQQSLGDFSVYEE